MNLEDVLDPEAVNSIHALQQDEWSLSKPRFGEEGQLEVVGWSGKHRNHKYYILKCSTCLQDSELFGQGYFRSIKSNLVKRQIPCGCARRPRWSQVQKTVLARRVLLSTSYTLKSILPFEGKDMIEVHCARCAKDPELFGQGNFVTRLSNMRKGQVPCGCGKGVQWSQEQFYVLCSRKAKEFGYKFLGFVGEWEGIYTRVSLVCDKHSEWSTGCINHLINGDRGCPECGRDNNRAAITKPDDIMVKSFLNSKSFPPDTKFWRSERLNSRGYPSYWYYSCPDCGEIGEATGPCLQKGNRSCSCSKQRQQECYINWIIDENNNAIAIKFGIARDSKKRVKDQARHSTYTLKQHAVYTFPSVQQCKQAERECKKELETGVVLKRDMPDGWTETTWSYNIGKVVDIYKRNGGVLV